MPLFERPQEPRPESQREREDRLIAKLVRMEHEARRHASDDWDVQPQPKDVPYPFIFEPNSGWLNWGTQGGVHDEIVNNLYRTGERVPNGAFFGRWYPHSDHVEVYDPQYFEQPYRQQQQHQETVLRNAPGRRQEPVSDHAWSGLGLGDQDDWKVAARVPVMYHVAPTEARAAIEQEGLRAPVYVFDNLGQAEEWWDDCQNGNDEPSDIWEINSKGLPDPTQNENWVTTYYFEQPVPPTLLRLLPR